MTNPIRNEASLVLVVAVIFSAVAIPVLSAFLEPSQPPAVAAIEIGDPRDDEAESREGQPAGDDKAESREGRPAGDAKPRRSAKSRSRERPAQPAPSAPADDAAEDDGGEAD